MSHITPFHIIGTVWKFLFLEYLGEKRTIDILFCTVFAMSRRWHALLAGVQGYGC